MENSLARPNQASTQLSKQSTSFEREDKLSAIVTLLTKLGIRRQAKLDTADYLVLAEDLAKFSIEDIAAGLEDLAKYPRKEGETAFPEIARLKQPIIERKLVREAEEIRKQEAEEAQYAKDHPEEFMTFGDLMKTPEAAGVMQKLSMEKARIAQREEKARSFMPPPMKMTPDEIKAAVAKERAGGINAE